MSQVIWTPSALADVQRLHEFLREKDPIVAREAVKSIRQNLLILAGHPEIGRPLDYMPIEFREWLIDFG
ncbi:type II toxin-antitoxin system RelE/ParE family toxin [Idiomarina tyrosinivorans]|uniref:type II toxin-antitoxin system RelE/ParE family toxin n=1 Tax=Idiomarina tyrosinivorans TaxID=1445662 RepID=UPI001F540C59|nr:type II toxin-antitoxin system RelE/ParE family toxin [Idiomarina tyrosinivorans]